MMLSHVEGLWWNFHLMRGLHWVLLKSLTFQIGSISWQTPSWSIFPNSRPTFRILHYQYDFESPIACLGRDSTDFQRKQLFLDHRWALELVGPKRINTHIWVFLYLTPILYNIVLSFTLCKNLARMTSTNQNMAGKEVTSGKRRMQRGKSGKMSLTMANTNVMPR